MRKYIFTLFSLLFLANHLLAQTDITIGTGTIGNGSGYSYPCPMQDYYEGSRSQYLYRASELAAAGMGPGMISAVKFNVVNVNNSGLIEQYTIKIAGTAVTTLGDDTWEPTGAPVFGPVDYTAVAGVNAFPFTTSFFWNGTDNIIVEVCNGGDDWTGNPTIPWTTNLGFNASRSFVQDNNGSLCDATSTQVDGTATTRPNIIFSWTPASACTGIPNAGTANTSVSSVCLGESFNLNLTGATVASGLTYQWQSSPNNTTWTNIPGATTAYYTATQTATSYYRCVVTCTNAGGGSANSASVQVNSPTLVSGIFDINSGVPTNIPLGTFNSFNDAYNYIKCGINGPVTFNVISANPIHNEQLIMRPVPGASATNTVTFNGNGKTISYTSTNGNQRATIKLDGADHITFNNLVIVAGGSTSSEYGFGVQLINDADSNTVNNCTININTTSDAEEFAGIVVTSDHNSATNSGEAKCDANTFSNNTITGGYYGITLVGSDDFANGSNKIINNVIKDFYNYGMYISYTFNTQITGNTISRPTRTEVTDFYGIYLTNLNTKDSISRNRITDPFGGATASTDDFYGVYFSSVDALSSLENIVSNNLIYNITGNGSAYGFYNSSSDNVYYYHNTLVMDGSASSNSAWTRAFYFTSSRIDGINFINNIVYISRGGPGPKHALFFGNNTSTVVSDKNVLFIAPGVTNAYIGSFGTNRATLADWQTASTQDAGSLVSNPMFASPSTGNYSPVNASIDNRGMPVGIGIDINSATRSATTPDIGAYEFTPPPCTVPPTPGTATVGKSPVCVNTRVTFGLTGNTVGLTQTYQWQVAAAVGGPYTNLGGPLTNPDTIIIANVTSYYRVAVTCSGNTAYSAPVLLEVNQALAPDTYTIDKTAPVGTPKNYLSFNEARAALECGIAGPVVFNVVAGRTTYEEQLILDSIPGASAVNTITFMGNGNTIHFSSDDTDERAVIKLRRADHFIFDSLRIDATGTGDYGYGVQLIDNADSNIVRKCIITIPNESSSSYAGVVINASDNSATSTGNTFCDANLFEKNSITGGYYGVTLFGDEDVPVLNNRFVGNEVKDFYANGFYLSYTTNTLIDGNSISRPANTDNSFTVIGINAYWESNKLTISRNRIFNPFGGNPTTTNEFYGIYMQYATANEGAENMVVNNVIYNINGRGTIYALYHNDADNVFYYHNTISLDNVDNTANATTRGFYSTSDVAGIRFFNNIITITRGGNGNKHGIYINSTNSDITSDYNDIYVKGGGTQNYVGYAATGNRTTLADWQSTTNQDAHTISMDPVYADMVVGNLSPVISPLDNTGTPLGILVDVDSKTRSTTTPDIGAFEITIPPCVAPPVAGTATAVPANNVCMGAIISLSLTGNTTGGGQTYRWQASRSATGPWRYITEDRYVKEYKTELTLENNFRCMVMCGGDTSYSAVANVNMNAPLPSGFYTINPGAPAGTPRNYTSFAAAVASLECGIAGWVTFNVSPGTYTEQIRMHRVYGASDTSRVTFQSLNHDPAGVILTATGTNAANYVLKLDSATYITYKEITIKSNGTYARAVELAGLAAYDSILNCAVTAPAATTSNTNNVGIYANQLKGRENVIKGNTVTNGSTGIYLYGTSDADQIPNLTVDSNTVVGSYQYNIYTYYASRLKIRKNTILIRAPRATTSYGIYTNYSDSAYAIDNNIVNIQNTTGTVYGIYVNNCDNTAIEPGAVSGNKIHALTGNTGTQYALETYNTSWANVVNNVISIKTTAGTSYGLYAFGDDNNNFYNNSVLNSSTSSAATNMAAFFSPDANVKLRNNIFAHNGGRYPLGVEDRGNLNSDYNTLYTSGATLVHEEGFPDIDRPTLQQWRDEADLDLSSIVYKPAFVSDSSLVPDIANPDVWAIHGRGVQVAGNDHDINGQPRPTTLIAGVPDMGAYEFLPTAIPPVLPATPADPAPGITQTFMFGTDTVSRITWGPTAPSTVTVRRYSGVLPPNIDQSKEFMYFYTDMEPGSTPYSFDIQQFYVDSWQGSFKDESQIRLGRTTDLNNTWKANDSSKLEAIANIISDTSLTFLNKFTGLKGNMPTPPPVIQPSDSSNRGTRFWVGYGHHQFFTSGNTQDMVLYLSAEQAANVTVRINGTSWEKHYSIPANTVITSDLIPKSGLSDARLMAEGFSEKGISIESDIPVVAYAHIYGSASSGATMLLPVGTYGYEYYTLSSKQNYGTDTYSWFYVIAEYDNTVVEITPSRPTLAGRPADVPFTVTLNRGEVYQVLGALIAGTEGYDLSGSRVRSVHNADGKCYPVAVFSGSSRTRFGCGGPEGGGDNLIQQNFPSQAWGRNYLTAPTSTDSDPAVFMTNIFRVLVKDPATVVKRNGAPLTGLINNRYYEFQSNTADYIQSDLPVMVAQYMSSTGGCDNTDGMGDPEMIYLSPIEQGIKKVGLYRNTKEAIGVNYLTLIIPTAGVPSLLIDGTNNFDYVYPHTNLPGYTVVVKRWEADTAQAIVTSDSAFTAITYGLGSVESYGYNAGTLVKNLNTQPSFSNIYGGGGASDYTCAKTPFRFSMLISLKPTSLKWELSKVGNLTPSADVVQTNPVPEDSVEVNGRKYFRYAIDANYVFSAPGTYYVPITMTHPDIESCNNSLETILTIKVIGAPVVDFTVAYSGCVSDTAQFRGIATTANGVGIASWKWNFGESVTDTAIIKDPLKKYNAPGVYNVKLNIIAEEGCIGDTTLPVTVNAAADVALVDDSLTVCAGDNATLNVKDPVDTITYNWYDAATGGTLAGSGPSLTIPNINATASYYVEAVKDGCTSLTRTRGVVTVFPQLTTPVVKVDTIGVNMIRFKWNAVQNATGYEVSLDNGVNWGPPSSGNLGLTHTVNGLRPAQEVTLLVKAKGCEDRIADPVSAKTLPDGIFIPNAFSPNGDGLNDVLRVYGYIIKDLHFMIFNQWGEKVFETITQTKGWDGKYKGTMQPSGVYIYVCRIQLVDGSVVEKKGAINLIR